MEDNNEIRESKIGEETVESVEQEGGKGKKGMSSANFRGMIILVAAVLVLALVLGTKICDNCGALIFGKGYYAPEAMFSAKAAEYTVCDTCADKLWSPFNYKNHAK